MVYIIYLLDFQHEHICLVESRLYASKFLLSVQ